MNSVRKRHESIGINLVLFLIFTYSFGTYTYFIVRYNGNFYENDTSVLTVASSTALEEGNYSDNRYSYPSGITYVAFLTFLNEFTGLELDILQIYILPLLISLIVFIAFTSFRALLVDNIAALIATAMLYLQPDFLFVTWRGSHEKLTWAFTLTLILLLSKSFTHNERRSYLISLMIMFYFIAFALISTNIFFANSFIAALIISFFFGSLFFSFNRWLKTAINPQTRQHVIRLSYIALSCLIFVYIILFYLYPPTLTILRGFQDLTDQLQLLLFERQVSQLEQTPEAATVISFDAYQYVREAWTSTYIYFVLTSYSWILLITSGLVWLYGIYQMWRTRTIEGISWSILFLWLLFPAFALQLFSSTVADQADTVGGNLQVRLFTPVIIVSIPISAIALRQVFAILPLVKPRIRFFVVSSILFSIPFLVFTSYIKAINDPLFNNNWLFTIPSEQVAASWSQETLRQNSIVWTGADNRLVDRLRAKELQQGDEEIRVEFDGFFQGFGVRYLLISSIEEMRWIRANIIITSYRNENVIYDNGRTKIYHLLPDTPYQR